MDVFEVHLIPPGTYLLNGAENYRLNTRVAKLKPLGTTDEVSKDIGATRLADVDYRFYSWKKVWVPPGVLTDQHSQQVCISVHVASGNCVAWGTQNYETSRPTEGYWDDRIVPEDIPAVRIRRSSPRPTRTGLHCPRRADPAQPLHCCRRRRYRFNANDCAPVDKLTGCALRRFRVHHQPAPLEAARKHINYLARPQRHAAQGTGADGGDAAAGAGSQCAVRCGAGQGRQRHTLSTDEPCPTTKNGAR